MDLRNRKRGALIGIAVGDALGAAVEFKPRGSFPLVTGYRAGGPHWLDPGEWTDDTSMALAMADSLSRGWDLNDQARQYVEWLKKGKYSVTGSCFDIGMTCRAGLEAFRNGEDASVSGPSDEMASGNGSIMRLAPIPIRYADLFPDRVEELAEFAADSSRPTHGSKACLSACRAMAVILAGLMHGLEREEVLSPDWEPMRRLRAANQVQPDVARVLAGSYREKPAGEIRGSGYVVASMEAALWAFHDAPDFRTAVLKAVNLGDDADTTGAVCGQFAGAFWGESGIPEDLLAGLARKEMIEKALVGIGAGIV